MAPRLQRLAHRFPVLLITGPLQARLTPDEGPLRGAFPAIHHRDVDAGECLAACVSSHLERDVRQLIPVRSLCDPSASCDRWRRAVVEGVQVPNGHDALCPLGPG